jgi:hypothetical protein
MKKIFFVLILAACTLATYAQKGSWYIGGQVGFNSGTTEETEQADVKTTSWSLAPEVGTFLSDNLQLGFALNLYGSTEEQESDKITTSSFAPVLYLRNFYKVSDLFSVFAGIVGSYSTGTQEYTSTEGSVEYTLTGYSANISLGAAFAVSSKFTAVAQYGLLGYSSQTVEMGDTETTDTNFGININSLGPVFNVGLYYTL